jgi:hypothetical protein
MEIDQKDEKTYTNVRAFRILKLREPMNNQQNNEEDGLTEDYETIPAESNDQPPF